MKQHEKNYDLICVGNAIVDAISQVSESFIAQNAITKGAMNLVDQTRALYLYDQMSTRHQSAGGSAANTAAIVAELGGRVKYVSKVADDMLGQFYADDLRKQGVIFETERVNHSHHPTGRSMIFVTPDGERSMNTFLGASEYLSIRDVTGAGLADTAWLYLEGYRYDGPNSQEAFAAAVNAVKEAGGKTSVTLSDSFCVERHRGAFEELIDNGVDLVFANKAEFLGYFRVDDFDKAVAAAESTNTIWVVTVGAEGAYVIGAGTAPIHAAAKKVTMVDATAAGDYFAAGFLYGVIAGKSWADCARIGCVIASDIVARIGTRSDTDYAELLENEDLF